MSGCLPPRSFKFSENPLIAVGHDVYLPVQVRKTAEKLLLKKLKAHLLEEEKSARAATKSLKAAAAEQKQAERKSRKTAKPARKRTKKNADTAPEADAADAPGSGDDGGAAASESMQVQANQEQSGMAPGAGTSAAMLQRAGEAALAGEAAAAAEAADIAEAADVAEAAELAAAAEALEDDVDLQAGSEADGSEEESDGELDLDAVISAGGAAPTSYDSCFTLCAELPAPRVETFRLAYSLMAGV